MCAENVRRSGRIYVPALIVLEALGDVCQPRITFTGTAAKL